MRALLLLIVLCTCGNLAAQIASTNRVISPEINPDRTVTFRLEAPKAQQATLFADWMRVGTSEKMSQRSDGLWTLPVGPISPGIYIYTFAVDGLTIADPVNPKMKLRARTSASL